MENKLPEKAKVSVLVGEKKIDVRELPLPEINDDEVLVRVEGCGICGTDVHEYKGDPFGYIPIQLGHEGTGAIVKLGKNVTQDYSGKPLNVGDKIVTGLKPCGHCDTCKNDPANIHLCPGGEIFGLMPGEDHFFNGWFGEYIKINAGGVIFNVSDMEDLDSRLLIEPAAVVVHAVEKAKEIFNFKHNSHVLVQGCGPIGLLLLTTVRTMGCRNIIAVDGDERRLAMAKKLGARVAINFMKEDAIARVQERPAARAPRWPSSAPGLPRRPLPSGSTFAVAAPCVSWDSSWTTATPSTTLTRTSATRRSRWWVPGPIRPRTGSRPWRC